MTKAVTRKGHEDVMNARRGGTCQKKTAVSVRDDLKTCMRDDLKNLFHVGWA